MGRLWTQFAASAAFREACRVHLCIILGAIITSFPQQGRSSDVLVPLERGVKLLSQQYLCLFAITSHIAAWTSIFKILFNCYVGNLRLKARKMSKCYVASWLALELYNLYFSNHFKCGQSHA